MMQLQYNNILRTGKVLVKYEIICYISSKKRKRKQEQYKTKQQKFPLYYCFVENSSGTEIITQNWYYPLRPSTPPPPPVTHV